MSRMNITEYVSEADEYQMYYGKATLKEGYYFDNIDERCFHLVGKKNLHFSVPELIHPDDVDSFMEAVEKLSEGPQHLIVRLLCYTEKYRCIYMVLSHNGRERDGFASIDMDLCEVMAISAKYSEYQGLVTKYREFLSLFTGLFLEYDHVEDMLSIYGYKNRYDKMHVKEKLEKIYIRVLQDEKLTVEQKAEFQTLYGALRGGRNHIKLEIDAKVLFEEFEDIRYEIKLSLLYEQADHKSMVGVLNAINGEKAAKDNYLTDSAFDPGTGLLNKRAIKEYAIEKIQNKTAGVYLAIIDIDDFKQVNDNFGHMYGDEVLSKLADIIRSVVKTRGVVGRFGGDEFMVVFEGLDSEETLRRILGTISKNVAWEFGKVEGLKVTTTIGVSKYPEDGTDYDKLFRTADKCVYIGKSKGKNRYILYTPEKHGPVEEIEEGSVRINASQSKYLSDERKCEIVSDLVLDLYRDGKKALVPVMEQLMICFGIDGIALYAGEKMERICSVGEYENPIQSLVYVREDSYQEFLDQQGFCQMIRTMLEKKAPELFELYSKQKTEKAIQCSTMRDGKPVSLVSFDVFDRILKVGTTDLGLMKIIGRVMADVIAE